MITFMRRDVGILFALFILAALLRFPFIAFPPVTMFDELIYRNYINMALSGTPSFDIHPPFTKLLMLEISKAYDFIPVHSGTKTMQPFSDFPYVPLRSLPALAGSLLPLIVYIIGRQIGYGKRAALFPALAVTLDSALILYSRVMLPDMILLTLCFAGLSAAFAAAKETGRSRGLFAALAVVLLSGAFSTKWTALAVVLVALVLFIRKKMWSAVFGFAVVLPLIYIGSFLVFFQYFPAGGAITAMFEGKQDPYNVEWITSVEFPRGGNLGESLAFLPELHRTILRANTDDKVNEEVYRPEGPFGWPLGKSSILFWHQTDGPALIRLTGNIVLWGGAFLLFMYACLSFLLSGLRKEHPKIGGYELLLTLGYLANYLPFFLIDRPMYLYHYFTALVFLFLLAPKILPRAARDLAELSGRPEFPNLMLRIALVAAAICFIVLLPTTYGFSF